MVVKIIARCRASGCYFSIDLSRQFILIVIHIQLGSFFVMSLVKLDGEGKPPYELF
jgi:hypothetical protein